MANIFKEAKTIQRMHKSWDWQRCIQVASQRHKKKKVGSSKKKTKYRQTGSSNKKRDQERAARPPGARIPAGGKSVTYYERRKNRSDVPGQLTGLSLPQLKSLAKRKIKNSLAAQLLKKELTKGKVAKRKVSKKVSELKQQFKKFL